MSDYVRTYIEVQEEVLRIPLKRIRELGGLPKFVETVAVMPPPQSNDYWKEDEQFLYIRIRTPWSPIRQPNTMLTYDQWDSFLERIKGFLRQDADQITAIQQANQ